MPVGAFWSITVYDNDGHVFIAPKGFSRNISRYNLMIIVTFSINGNYLAFRPNRMRMGVLSLISQKIPRKRMLFTLIKAGTILLDFMSLERPFSMEPTFFQVQNLFQIDKSFFGNTMILLISRSFRKP